MRMLTRLLNSLAILIVLATGASAQDWAKPMFDHLEHDFGVVARGAKAEHRFTIQNIYLEEAHIQSVSSSCGCTSPAVTKNTIKTWEKVELIATIDTRSFMGHKEAAVTVRFDRPFPAEVILRVQCFIRGDVVVQPGAIEFGSVNQGSGSERRAVVQYAGRGDWRVMAVEKSNKFVDVRMTEADRNQGQVSYDLVVRLKTDTPPGYIHEQLVLVTNDTNPRTARVPITVEGVVVPSLTVRPSPLLLGVVNAGQTVTKHLVVQGNAPFKIAGVQCKDSRFRFQIPQATQTLHVVPITFAAGDLSGNVNQTVHIETVGGAGLDIGVYGEVVAPSKPLEAAGPAPAADPPTTKKTEGQPGRMQPILPESDISGSKRPTASPLRPVLAPTLERSPSAAPAVPKALPPAPDEPAKNTNPVRGPVEF